MHPSLIQGKRLVKITKMHVKFTKMHRLERAEKKGWSTLPLVHSAKVEDQGFRETLKPAATWIPAL
jgi:hypothetical protein